MSVAAESMLLAEYATLLRESPHVVALTGAGISRESGLPTFREAQTGLWSRYRPEDLATPEAFARAPDLVWQWYAWRRALVRQAAPNAAHHALVRLAERAASFTLITQNVDGLHRQAGSTDVVELHGDIMRSRCSACRMVVHDIDEASAAPPSCPACGAHVRPDVVWFGETLPDDALAQAIEATRTASVLVVIGTSLQVQPAASLVPQALDRGAHVLDINPEPAALRHERAHALTGSASKMVPMLVDAAFGR